MTNSTLRPRLVIGGAATAIDFYIKALGAKELARYVHEDKIVHAELEISGVPFNLKDEDGEDLAPTSLGGSPVFLCLQIENVDAVAERMVEGGASVVYPIADHGDEGGYGGRLKDPFGHVWMISRP